MADTQASPAEQHDVTPATGSNEIIDNSGEPSKQAPEGNEDYFEDDSAQEDNLKERTKRRFDDMKDNYNKVVEENEGYKSKIEELETQIQDIVEQQKEAVNKEEREDLYADEDRVRNLIREEQERNKREEEKAEANRQIKEALLDLGYESDVERRTIGRAISRNAKELARIHDVSIKEGAKMAYDIHAKTRKTTPEEAAQMGAVTSGGGKSSNKLPDVSSNPWVTKGISPETVQKWKEMKAQGKL